MNENQNMCNVCGSGNGRCGQCGNMCGWGKNHILRWILGIIIITWVFSIGAKFGEVKGYLEQSGYGRSSNHMKYMMGGTYPTGGQWEGENVIFSTGVSAPTTGSVKVIKSN